MKTMILLFVLRTRVLECTGNFADDSLRSREEWIAVWMSIGIMYLIFFLGLVIIYHASKKRA